MWTANEGKKQVRAIWIAAACAVAGAAAAQEPEPLMANVLGNTLISINPQGVESHITYKPNHRFSGKVPSLRYAFKGVWRLQGQEVCRTYSPPIPNRPRTECSPTMPWLQVGQAFVAPNGTKVSLVEGRR
jgi:hypothetical protein